METGLRPNSEARRGQDIFCSRKNVQDQGTTQTELLGLVVLGLPVATHAYRCSSMRTSSPPYFHGSDEQVYDEETDPRGALAASIMTLLSARVTAETSWPWQGA